MNWRLGSALRASQVETLGDWRYVVAHRRLPDGDIVASPIPLRAGAAALRQRDVADLLGFAIVLGPILSLGLALFVGRALTRPIQTLQVASERVGSGNLAVHLPEDRVDEFGSVCRGVQPHGAATGRCAPRAVAHDAPNRGDRGGGRHRRDRGGPDRARHGGQPACRFAARDISGDRRGRAQEGEYAAALAEWLDGYARSGSLEADGDFRWGGRRIQVRARRIVQEGHRGGVVVNLEDVTDELRSERILAWGEMAKQVAHEVKNPLTPIKLSVQHLRRAWGGQERRFREDPRQERRCDPGRDRSPRLDFAEFLAAGFSGCGRGGSAGRGRPRRGDQGAPQPVSGRWRDHDSAGKRVAGHAPRRCSRVRTS